MKRADLEVQINELVLHGFAARDRYRIGKAIEREFTRQFVEQGVPPLLSQHREIELLNGGAFNIAAGAKPEWIGAQVAQAVYGQFKR